MPDPYEIARQEQQKDAAREGRRASMELARPHLERKRAERRRFKQLREIVDAEADADDYVELPQLWKSRADLRREMLQHVDWRCESCGRVELSSRRWHFFTGTRKWRAPVCLRCWARERRKKLGAPRGPDLPADMTCPLCGLKKADRRAWRVSAGVCRKCADKFVGPMQPRATEPTSQTVVIDVALLTPSLVARMCSAPSIDVRLLVEHGEMSASAAHQLLLGLLQVGAIERCKWRSKRFARTDAFDGVLDDLWNPSATAGVT